MNTDPLSAIKALRDEWVRRRDQKGDVTRLYAIGELTAALVQAEKEMGETGYRAGYLVGREAQRELAPCGIHPKACWVEPKCAAPALPERIEDAAKILAKVFAPYCTACQHEQEAVAKAYARCAKHADKLGDGNSLDFGEEEYRRWAAAKRNG